MPQNCKWKEKKESNKNFYWKFPEIQLEMGFLEQIDTAPSTGWF